MKIVEITLRPVLKFWPKTLETKTNYMLLIVSATYCYSTSFIADIEWSYRRWPTGYTHQPCLRDGFGRAAPGTVKSWKRVNDRDWGVAKGFYDHQVWDVSRVFVVCGMHNIRYVYVLDCSVIGNVEWIWYDSESPLCIFFWYISWSFTERCKLSLKNDGNS